MTAARDNTERPLVTFALFAYNQERFIREAVEGALSQDYSPLQIVLSDDCSSDQTFEIMQEVAAAYEGPHELVLNRNERNLGLGGHIRKVASMATGEIVVMAAGDDVSCGDRVSSLVNVYAERHDIYAVLSGFEVINKYDKVLEVIGNGPVSNYNTGIFGLARKGGGVGAGATYSYRRDVFFWPKEFPPECGAEDRLLPFRAALMGGVHHLRRPLVKYRFVENSISRDSSYVLPQLRSEHIEMLLETIDIAEREGRIRPSDRSKLKRILSRIKTLKKIHLAFLNKHGLVNKIAAKIIKNFISYDTVLNRLVIKFDSLIGGVFKGVA